MMSTHNVAIDFRLTLTTSLQVTPCLLSLSVPSIVPRTKKSSSGRGIAIAWLAIEWYVVVGRCGTLWGEGGEREKGEGRG